eukprot:s1023_g25.t1
MGFGQLRCFDGRCVGVLRLELIQPNKPANFYKGLLGGRSGKNSTSGGIDLGEIRRDDALADDEEQPEQPLELQGWVRVGGHLLSVTCNETGTAKPPASFLHKPCFGLDCLNCCFRSHPSMLTPKGDESEEASTEEAEENIELGSSAEDTGETAEEEDLDDDPIFEEELFCDDSDKTFSADDGRENTAHFGASAGEGILDLEVGGGREEPQVQSEVVEIVEVDVAEPAPLPSASGPAGPSLAVRQQPNKRHHQHPKSFSFGCFFVKYRDDRDKSELYADRVPSWTVMCPVHAGNCYLVVERVDQGRATPTMRIGVRVTC